jgi:hypothetical protein
LAREKSYAIFARHLKEHLYREEVLQLWNCPTLDQLSTPDESETEFRARLAPVFDARLSAEREKLESVFAKKLADADERVRKAEARLSTQRWQFLARLGSITWVIVDTVLSALGRGLPGRRRSLDPAFRSAATERGQQSTAQISLESALAEQQRLELQHQDQLKQLEAKFSATNLKLEPFELKPIKSDIEIDAVALAWLPWRIGPSGAAEPVYLEMTKDE